MSDLSSVESNAVSYNVESTPPVESDAVEVINFGCRLNIYEGEVIRRKAQEAGLKSALIFNGCAVTAEAERQLRQAIRKARRQQPEAKIIVTGCAAQINPENYATMKEVDKVIGNEEKLHSKGYEFIENSSEKALVNDIMSVKETAAHLISSFEGKARAFVQVQNGCDHRCTFCIIPFGRGNSRSVPIGEIVTQTKLLVSSGYQEIVLTGVDISDYGKDLPGAPNLGQMMRRLLAMIPQLPRLRLSSIDAVEVDDDLLALIADEPRLMPHFHLSIQSGDDMILKRMKRRHNRADIVKFCRNVRELRPDAVFGADIIAGFPTENEEMFQNTLRLVEEVGIAYLHVFPYSARAGTPAAKMPQVPLKIRKERASLLREAGKKQLAIYLQSRIGKKEKIIMEQPQIGRSEGFALVHLNKKQQVGSIVAAQICSADIDHLQAVC